MPFNIGDLVKRRRLDTDTIPTVFKGEVIDKLYSEAESKFFYKVRFENESICHAAFYGEELLEPCEEDVKANVHYIVETEILENVAVVKILKREENSTVREEIVRGHGHIIHEGDVGIVQALSYALKRAYEKINGGKV